MSDSAARLTSLLPVLEGLALLVLAPAAGAQTIVLNGPLAQPASGDVFWPFGFSGDRKYVVYRADQDQDQLFGLYAARLGSKDPAIALHVPPTAEDGVFGFATGPGDLVFFRARNEATGEVEIRGMSIEGASPTVSIGGGFPSGTELWPMMVSEPARRVVFGAQLPGQSWYGVHSAPCDGSGVPAELTGSPSDIVLTPDGMHLVFLGSTGGEEMFIVPIDGSEFPRWLAAPLAAPGAYISFLYGLRLTADGRYVFYQNNVQGAGPDVVDLYSRSLTGVGGARLNLASSESMISYDISPRGDRILLYEPGPTLDSVAVDGSGRVSLLAPGELPGGSVISPDGNHVALVASGSLKRVAIDGSEPPLTLAPPQCSVYGIEPSSATVLFRRRDPATSAGGLYAMPFDGSAPPTELDVLTRPTQDIRGVWISSSPARLIYKTDRTLDEKFELYSVPLDGSAPPRRLNGPLSPGGDVDTVILTPDGKRILFLADERDEVLELFEVSVDGGAGPRRVNEPLPLGPVLGDVTSFQVAPGGEEIVYRADQENDEVFDLFSVRVRGDTGERNLTSATNGVPLSFATGPGGRTVFAMRNGSGVHELRAVSKGGTGSVRLDVGGLEYQPPFVFTADGSSLVYKKRRTTVASELKSISLDGEATPVTLAAPPGTRLSVPDIRVGNGTVFFRADLSVIGRLELYRVPLDGSLAPLRLNAPLGPAQLVVRFELSADRSRIVYLADQEVDDRLELYTVSANGRPAPIKLSPVPGAGGTVTDFVLVEDGNQVVYRSRASAGGRFDLFSVLLDRVGVVPLTAGITHPRDGFRVARDGRDVVYMSRPPGSSLTELFRVPLDGSAPPQRISDEMVPAATGVLSFALSPDGRRVVYLADQRTRTVLELFTVDVLGGPVRAIDAMPVFADVDSYQISPDSRHVAYRANRDAFGRLELFGAPLDGSSPAKRVNGTLPTGAIVHPDYSLLTGGRVIFRADQGTRTVVQLYLGFAEDALAVTATASTPTLAPRRD